MNLFSGASIMGHQAEAISKEGEGTTLTYQNGGQLPKIAGNLALAFGDILRSVALHVSELEGQLAHTDVKRVTLSISAMTVRVGRTLPIS